MKNIIKFLEKEEEYFSKMERKSRSINKEKGENKKGKEKAKKEKRERQSFLSVDALAFAEGKDLSFVTPTELIKAEQQCASLWVEGTDKNGKPFWVKPKNFTCVKRILDIQRKLLGNPKVSGIVKKNRYYKRIFLLGFSIEKIKAVDKTYISVLKRENGSYDFRFFEFEGCGIKLYDHNPKEKGKHNLFLFKKRKQENGKTQKYFVCLTSSKVKEESVIKNANEGIE